MQYILIKIEVCILNIVECSLDAIDLPIVLGHGPSASFRKNINFQEPDLVYIPPVLTLCLTGPRTVAGVGDVGVNRPKFLPSQR